MATASPFLRVLPCSLLLLPVLLPAEDEITWTKLHQIEEIGNIDFVASDADGRPTLHVDLNRSPQQAGFVINLKSTHQRWCHQTEAPDGQDFPVDIPRTLWVTEPMEAGVFITRSGSVASGGVFTPSADPHQTVFVGAVVYSDPPPSSELSEEDPESQDLAAIPPEDQPHHRVRWWHRPVDDDGNPRKKPDNFLQTFKVGVRLRRSNVEEDVVWEDDTSRLAVLRTSTSASFDLETGKPENSAIQEGRGGEHELPGLVADEGEHQPNTFPQKNFYTWTGLAGSEDFLVTRRIFPDIKVLPVLRVVGVESIEAQAFAIPRGDPVDDLLFAFRVLSVVTAGATSIPALIISDLKDREGVDQNGAPFCLSSGAVLSGIDFIGSSGDSIELFHNDGSRRLRGSVSFDEGVVDANEEREKLFLRPDQPVVGKAAVQTKIHGYVVSELGMAGSIGGQVRLHHAEKSGGEIFVEALAVLEGLGELPGEE